MGMENIELKNYLIALDGVLISGNTRVPGADGFVQRLRERGAKFLVLTNNSRHTPGDLALNLRKAGLPIRAEEIFTSALATARYLHSQKPDGTAYVIGESGLISALRDVDYELTERDPDYVVLGGTSEYNLEQITHAINLIRDGARFICTNPDTSGQSEEGLTPACGAMAALIETATGVAPFFVGKPNPLMVRSALAYLGTHSEDTAMVGDRMDTDVIAGIQSGMETILVLSGVTRQEDVARFAYKPTHIIRSVADLDP
ncbi:MAG: HAD-IIA family hydrolase [Chloroflexi bacterium]|nr:HAD-IIA family hydrolase [Chloroflexota bacterium]